MATIINPDTQEPIKKGDWFIWHLFSQDLWRVNTIKNAKTFEAIARSMDMRFITRVFRVEDGEFLNEETLKEMRENLTKVMTKEEKPTEEKDDDEILKTAVNKPKKKTPPKKDK